MTRNNDTPYRKKGLSVFLTVLMVLSVVAMTAFVAAPVAADDHSIVDPGQPADLAVGVDDTAQDIAFGTIDLDRLDDDEEYAAVQIDINNLTEEGVTFEDGAYVTITSDAHDDEAELDTERGLINITLEGDGELSEDVDITELTISGVNTSDADAETGLQYNVSLQDGLSDDPLDGGVFDSDTYEPTESALTSGFNLGTADANQGPVSAVLDDEAQEFYVEAVFDDGFNDLSEEDVVLFNKSGAEVTDLDSDAISEVDLNGDGVVSFVIDTDHEDAEDATLTTGDNYLQVLGINHSIQLTTTTFEEDRDDEVLVHGQEYAGETIAILGDRTEDPNVGVEITTPDTTVERQTGENSHIRTLATDRAWSGDNVSVEFLAAGDEYETELGDFGDIDISVDDVDENEDIEVDIVGDRIADRNLDIRLINPDGDVDQVIWDEPYDSEGEISVTFDGVDEEGTWTVEATETSTNIADSADFVVEDVVIDAEVEFGEITGAAEGDIVEIELEFEDAEDYGDDEVLVWINESDYDANLSIELDGFDDDSLTIEWNTYEAGDDGAFSIDHEDASVDVLYQTDIDRNNDFRLNPGGYSLSVFDDGEGAQVQDTGSVTVSERHTGEATTYIAPKDADYDSVHELLEDATESASVAEGDLLIVEQEISGIFGYGIDDGEFADDKGLEVLFENTEAPAYAFADSFNETDGHVDLVADADNETIYFIVEVDEEGLDEDDVQEWDYTLTVGEDNAYIADEDAEETAETDYEVTERMAQLDLVESPYQVTPTEDAEIRGVSTLAPGSEIDVTVNMPGVFVDSETVNVTVNDDGDRVFVFAENYSDREVGEEFTITVEFDDESEETDGIFADIPEWETKTDAEEMRQILDELKDILDVEDDEDVVDAVEDLVADLEAAEDTIAELEADLADAEGDLADAEAEISELEDDLMEISTALEEAQDTIEEWQEAAGADTPDDLRDRIDDLNAEISGLEGDVSDLEDEVADLESQIGDWQDATGADSPDDAPHVDDLGDDDDDQPAFGPIAALIAILAGGALVAKRRFA